MDITIIDTNKTQAMVASGDLLDVNVWIRWNILSP